MATNHEELMRRLQGVVDLPEDVIGAILTELYNVAAASEMTLRDVCEVGYQDFAGWECPHPES